MKVGRCGTCGNTDAAIPKYRMARVGSPDEKIFCEPCANSELQGASKGAFRVARYVDPTVCSKCRTDYGSSELPLLGGAPFCPTCRESLYQRSLPKWLTLSMAGMLALLAFALLHGARFFGTEKSLILAERRVEKREYAGSIPLLQAVVATAPNCEKCILLLAKAELLTGRSDAAYKLIHDHKGGSFESSALATEVSAIATRVGNAFKKAQEAGDLERKKQWQAAADKMREASNEYPEQDDLRHAAEAAEEGVAFEAKDYDKFLALSEAHWAHGPESTLRAGAVASALACKYVATGDPEMKSRSEEMLEKARALAKVASPEEQKAFKEFEERILYRLNAHEIIDTDEYYRRFHPELVKEVKK
jgi:hypothetical protein